MDWASLHGKVVVVAFSSDSAVPDDVKEWNEFPEKFKGEPVVFIQVAGGSEFLLDQALKKIPNRGCVLFDSKQANHRNFRALDLTTVIALHREGSGAEIYHYGPLGQAAVPDGVSSRTR